MIARSQQHWLCHTFVQRGSILSKISSRLLLNLLLSIAVTFMLPQYTHLGIKSTLAPLSILGIAITIFLVSVIMLGMPVTLKRENFGGS